jgi:AcrR family transcriptional regulator
MAVRDEQAAIGLEVEWAGLRLGAADAAAAEAMQQRIVATAERLYRQYGYQKTTVADIAAELGMSPANVYRFFASKTAIIEAVTRKVTSEIVAEVREAIAVPGLSARERLSLFATVLHRAVVQRCIGDQRLHAMVHVAIEQNSGVVMAFKETLRRMIAAIIADGVAAGEFEVEDVDIAAHCFQAAMISCCHPVIVEHRLRNGEDIEATLEPLLAFAFRGLGARDPG